MLDLGELVGRLRLDDSDWGAPLDRAEGKTKAFGSNTLSTIKGVVGGVAALWGGVELTQKFVEGINYASDLNETLSKSQNIFGEQAAGMEKWASTATTSVGLSQNAALAAAAGFGDMFTQIGFTGVEAAKMSQNVVQASADLGSFSNLDTADVADRMSAAFRGEYDSLQAVIPGINAARVESEALAMTGKDTAASLTAQEKAAAVLAIVQKDGAKAMGDFARTSDGYANSSKIVNAQMEELGGKLGALVLPMLQGLQQLLLEQIIPAFESLVGWIAQNQEMLLQIGTAIAIAGAAWLVMTAGVAAYNGVMTVYRAIVAAGSVAQWAMNAAMAANPVGLVVIAIAALIAILVLLIMNWDAVVAWVTEVWGGFVGWLGETLNNIGTWWSEVWGGIVAFFTELWEGLVAWAMQMALNFYVGFMQTFNNVRSFFEGLWNGIVSFFTGIWNGIIDFITGVLLGYITFWMSTWNNVRNFFTSLWTGVVSFFEGVWNGIVSFITGIIAGIVAYFTSSFGQIRSFLASVWSGISSTVSSVWNGIVSFLTGLVNGIVSFFTSSFNRVSSFLSGIWSGIGNVIRDTWNGVMSFLGGIPDKIMGFFSGIGSWLWNAGRDLINGLLDGIRSLAGTIGNFFLGLLPDWIVGPFKMALGIASPSKLFREYGRNTVQGYLRGVEDLKPELDSDMQRLVNTPDVKLAGSAHPGSSGGSTTNTTTHKTVHYHAAEHQSLSGEEALLAALSSPRVED